MTSKLKNPLFSSPNTRSIFTLILFFTLFAGSATATDYPEPKKGVIDNSVLKGKTKAKAQSSKMGPFLRALKPSPSTDTQKRSSTLQSNAFVNVKSGSLVQVYISLARSDDNALRALENDGVEIEVVNTQLNKVQGWIDYDSIALLESNDNVQKVTAPKYGTPRQGSRLTQGDAILRANQLRARGFTGKGVRVGIVSDGANARASAQASGDLPQQVTTFGSCTNRIEDPQNCIGATTCNEGTAMAEIIHDIAPDAELAIAAVGTSLEFIQRINQLANQFRANVIVDDLGFFGEPYFSDGDLALAVAALPADILYVSSAGNSGNSHYEDNFLAAPPVAGSSRTFHDFGRVEGLASRENMGFIVGPQSGVVTLLQWNEPFENPSSDYDLFIVDSTAVIATSIADQASGAPAFEATCSFNPTNTDQAQFAFVERFSGSNRRLEMFFLGSRDVQFNNPAGSIFGHPGVPRAVAVGTINANEPGNNNIAFFSSHGPSRVDFPSFQNRAKPDVTGIDGVSVTGAGGFPSTFFGTSAAAPHVAGIAAQLISARRNLETEDLRRALTETSVDLGAGGRDNVYGFGRVDAVAAEAALKKDANTAPLLLLLLDED